MVEDSRPRFESSFASRNKISQLNAPASSPSPQTVTNEDDGSTSKGLPTSMGNYLPSDEPPSEPHFPLSEHQSRSESEQELEEQAHDPSEFLIRQNDPIDDNFHTQSSYEMGPSLEEGYRDKFFSGIDTFDRSRFQTPHLQQEGPWADMSMIAESLNMGNMSASFGASMGRSSSSGSKSTPTAVRDSLVESIAPLVITPPTIPSFNLGEDPLHFLKTQEALLLNNLEELLLEHSRLLARGSNKVSRVRLKMFAIIKDISETQQAMLEIYNRERSNRMKLLSTFERWEERKQRLLSKINGIRSPDSVEGAKYGHLLQQSNETKSEIASLEERLTALKQKHRVINKEMLETQSLMETRASSYVQSLENIESHEETAILQLSSYVSNGSGSAVDENQLASSLSGVNVPSNIVSDQVTKARSPSVNLNFSSLFGLIKSDKSGDQPRQESVVTEKNPIEPMASRIDARLIVESLARQVSALDDLIGSQSNAGEKSKESVIILSDVFESIRVMEKRLKDLSQLALSSSEIENAPGLATKALRDTLAILGNRIQTVHRLNLEYVEMILKNEIDTVAKGERIISGESPASSATETESPQKGRASPAPVSPGLDTLSGRFSRSDSPASAASPSGSGLVMENFKTQSAVASPALTLTSFSQPSPPSVNGPVQAAGSFAGKNSITGLGKYSTINNALKIGKGGKRD
ncbi:unnamed protein product [Kuraishia capsulata CBS 1993]|uniref:Uncharacterized protein n=1 Tax=Kuraishia capsulata CBS 1993 TaxID=1382522 RepID=W6MIH9_9ASCO|nr:uncharacterized protein KUCA_T00000122001 [Kuraishia capsulata CBS 1993]CDK24162.1 unnamed protein product [Kuraishia capsulata CBS 1993]